MTIEFYEFDEHRPISALIFHEVNSLIRSEAIWNIMKVDKLFCKSIDGSFDRRIAGREGKSISKISG